MNAAGFQVIYTRNIDKLYKEIENFKSEENIWRIVPGISNTSGNLCLHLTGSLNHFIGNGLGKTGYVRNRDLEFSEKGVSKEILLEKLTSTKAMLVNVLSSLSNESLEEDFPYEVAGKNSVEFYLVFFAEHFNYHLGQVNYHRRISEAL